MTPILLSTVLETAACPFLLGAGEGPAVSLITSIDDVTASRTAACLHDLDKVFFRTEIQIRIAIVIARVASAQIRFILGAWITVRVLCCNYARQYCGRHDHSDE